MVNAMDEKPRETLSEKFLKLHEGFSSTPYMDTTGHLTIGYGRNLEDRGLTEREAQYLLYNDISESKHDLRSIIHYFDYLSDIRQAVLIDMRYNLGYRGFRTFEKMIMAVNAWEYERAALEMRDSRWYRQVGKRAERLAYMMAKNELHDDFTD